MLNTHRNPAISVLFTLLVSSLFALPCSAQPSRPNLLRGERDRVVFLGDSNTYAGKFISNIEAHLLQYPNVRYELLNLGLSSETAAGLSEPDHPFPRPCVLDRLDMALVKSHPDIVVACYGMNDGIYAPFDQARFSAFKNGMRKIVDASKAVGAKIVLMTPPPFDPFPLKGTEKLRSLDAKQFAWFAPYEKYDSDVLAKYSEWVGQQSDVDRIIDLHQALSAYIQNRRASDASFALAKDGVHFGDAIHEFVAGEVIKGLGLPLFSKPSKRLLDICHQRQCLLRDAWLSEIGHKRPGVKAGLPVLEAEKKAEQLRFQAQELVK